MIEINSVAELTEMNELINANEKILIDFAAKWCNPCKMVTAILNKFQSEFETNNIKVIKVNLDNDEIVTYAKQNFQITNIPTMFYYVNGVKQKTLVGDRQITVETVKELLTI